MVINDNNYIKTKIKTFKDSIITNFHDKKEPKEKISYKCLSITVLASVIKTDNKYYPQTFLEECVINNKNNKRIILLKNQNQIVTLIMNQNQNQIVILMMMKQNLILIMMNKFRKK